MRTFLFFGFLMLLGHFGFAQQPKLMLPIGHTNDVNSVQFSSDGKRFLTASLDNSAKLWDTQSGKILAIMYGHKKGVSCAIFSPGGEIIVTSDGSGRIKLWDASTGNFMKELESHDSKVIGTQFSPDEKKLMTNSADGTCKIWDWNSKKLLFTLECFKKTKVKTLSGKIEDVEDGELEGDFTKKEFKQKMRELRSEMDKFSKKAFEESKILLKEDAIKYNNKEIDEATFSKKLTEIINIQQESQGKKLKEKFVKKVKVTKLDSLYHADRKELESYEANYAEFSSNGQKIITTATDGAVRIWDAETGKFILQFKTILSTKPVLDVSDYIEGIQMAKFSKDNLKALTLSYYGVGIRDARTYERLNYISGTFSTVSFSPNQNKIITGGNDVNTPGKIEIWNSLSGEFITQLIGHKSKIESLTFSADGTKLISTSADKTAKLWDLKTNKLLRDFVGHTNTVSSAQFSPDGLKIITASKDHTIKIWDISNGNIIFDSKGHSSFGFSTFFSNDNSKILIAYDVGFPKIWGRYSGQIIGNLVDSKYQTKYAKYSLDDKKIVTNAVEGIKVWDSQSLKPQVFVENEKKYEDFFFIKPDFSPDGNLILTSKLGELYLLDAKNGEYVNGLTDFHRYDYQEFSKDGNKISAVYRNTIVKVWKFNHFGKFEPKSMWDQDPEVIEMVGHHERINSAKFSFDGEKIVTASSDYSSKIFDTKTGKELDSLIGHTDAVVSAEFSRDDKKIATCSWDGTAKIWDAKKGKLLFDLRGHNGVVLALNFSKDGKNLLTASQDNTSKVWDVETGKLKYTFFAIDSIDYFNYLPNGYYLSSKNASKRLHYVSKDLKIISFEQLDVKYNRPDKVLQAIGNPDTSLIKSYKRAYEKRIEKLKIDTTAFNDSFTVPESDFANRDAKELNGKITLTFKGEDKNTKLDQYNVWVNEVPIFGLRGVNIRKQNTNTFETTITIPLSVGKNQIEMSVRNVNGIESYRSPLEVNYKPNVLPKEKVYFVGIGIDKFKDKTHNLLYCAKDIRVLTAEMKQKYGDDLVIVDTLINANVTVQNVKALKKKLLNTTVDDKVIVAYSGHGLLSSKKDYYLSTYSVNFNKPEENGLNYDDLESVIDSIPARKKLLLLDACHSGEVDKEDNKSESKQQPVLKSSDAALTLAKAQPKNNKGGGEPEENLAKSDIGLRGSFELMQSLFVNVGKNTGATIFTAAAGKQVAYESDGLQHSIFTYYIIDALRNNKTLTVSKLKEIVAAKVATESKKSQIPTSRSETIAVDWVLW